ncbi:hypothetical protein M3Y99_00405900 [Aphelenchoides fujianensis]|nr:hypothetical protein M3Y99_00405900 [Aphelenchoides fujianensis]
MAEITRVSPAEIQRRENFLRANQRERTTFDPFTWSYPWKTAGVTAAIGLWGMYFHNLYTQKPWYFGEFSPLPLVCIHSSRFQRSTRVPPPLLAVTAVGYGMGKLREHHNRTRDAVVDHYIREHPDDFERLNDVYGRPYSNVLLPWYPRRVAYKKFD